MTDYVIPSVGSEGYYTTLPPFDTIIVPNVLYTCQAVRKLKDYLANNENPKEKIYDRYQLGDLAYTDDLKNDMPIVSLQAGVGQWIYVPARYITAYPVSNGVKYHDMMLAVNLGSIPVSLDLAPIKTAVSNAVHDLLGITPTVADVEISTTIIVPHEKHNEILQNRLGQVELYLSDRGKAEKAQVDIESLQYKIGQLETFIKANLPMT